MYPRLFQSQRKKKTLIPFNNDKFYSIELSDISISD